jgi:hypothetical protein
MDVSHLTRSGESELSQSLKNLCAKLASRKIAGEDGNLGLSLSDWSASVIELAKNLQSIHEQDPEVQTGSSAESLPI